MGIPLSLASVAILAVASSMALVSWIGNVQVDPPGQLQAFHHQGQTFLTWVEPRPELTEESVTYPKFREILKQRQESKQTLVYRIYRSDQPITSLSGLTPIGETGPLSCWNTYMLSGDRNTKDSDRVPRYVIRDRDSPLAPGTGVYVHNPKVEGKSKAFYAVSVVENGTESRSLDAGNTLMEPVEETQGLGLPVLQSQETISEFNFAKVESTTYHYVRWESPPNANQENKPIDFLVVVPQKLAKPTSIGLHLHCWGGSCWSGYGWWFNAEKGSILLAPHQDPYDWWTGYHELLGKEKASASSWSKGVVRPYSQNRVLSLLDWAATQWNIDPKMTFVAGNSMGGSGTPMLAIRHPERFAWGIAWVGVHAPQLSPKFSNSYAAVYGAPEWALKFEDDTPVWDHFNDIWYLRNHLQQETPFLSISNGKNDDGIGWRQAAEFLKALQDTKRPHMFVWGQSGHNQRALMPKTLDQRVNPLDLRVDQSQPAFTHCSLDGNPGNGDEKDGDPEGAINLYLYWETKDVIDSPKEWQMTVALSKNSPKPECTVDLTPRRLQQFRPPLGETLRWSNTSQGKVLQQGVLTVDENGLATIEGLRVTQSGNRIRLFK